MILDLILAFGQAPKILKVSFVTFHQMFVGIYKVDFFKHASFEPKNASKGHDPRFTVPDGTHHTCLSTFRKGPMLY